LVRFCGVEIDRDTGEVHQYVSLHDAGRILSRTLFDGAGRFAMAIGAALHERFVYDDSGSFERQLCRLCRADREMIPVRDPAPRRPRRDPLGAKGVAEGNLMSTPVCIANAVADALGVIDLELPLTAPRMLQLLKSRDV
jgi:2-furoyl-CoA dehydrogenase large subunit